MTLLIALFVILALLAVLVFYELSWKEKLKKRWVQVTLSIIFSAVLSPAIFHIIVSWNNRQREEAELQFRDAVITGLYNQKVEYKQLEQLLILKYKEIYDSGEKEAERWANNFLASLQDKRVEEERIEIQTQELVAALELRWNPFYKFLLSIFDRRATLLMKNSSTELAETKDVPIVTSNQAHQNQEILRKIIFPNGNQLHVELHTAVVDNGKITWYPNVIFRELIKGSQTTVFVITFRDNTFALQVGHPRHEGFLEEGIVHDDPLEDEKFLSLVNKAINRAFESGFL